MHGGTALSDPASEHEQVEASDGSIETQHQENRFIADAPANERWLVTLQTGSHVLSS